MRYILIFILLNTILFSKENESCYTVQLESQYNNKKNMDMLKEKNYPDSCLLMEIGNSITTRCGCYEKMQYAKENLEILKQNYKDAYIATTYKYRFEKKHVDEKEIKQEIEKEIKQEIEKEEPKSVAVVKKEKESCQTVQLISYSNTEKNKQILASKTFPKECVLMEIGNSLTVRCGCYESSNEVKEDLLIYQDEYNLAYVATTYKYRFGQNYKMSKPAEVSSINEDIQSLNSISNDDNTLFTEKETFGSSQEELRLMLQAFLYKNDLENAYKVANSAYKKDPNSYYWNQKMAEISRWTGRTEESVGYMLFLYNVKKEEKMRDDIIEYATSAYRYEDIQDLVSQKAVKYPTDENIQKMITIYDKTGSPEKTAIILEKEYKKDPSKENYLTIALKIYLDIGDLESAKRIVSIMEVKSLYTIENAILISSYYYLDRKMQKSYEVLLLTDEEGVETDVEFNKLLSDMSWYMQDYTTGAKGSQRLMNLKQARLIDYERVIFMYQGTNIAIVCNASKKAYSEHRLSYLFYGYANAAFELKEYEGLNKVIEDIDKRDSPLKDDAMYWIIKARLYGYLNKPILKRNALQIAITIDPNNLQAKNSMFWFFMEAKLDVELKKLLYEMTENSNLNPAFYMPIASAYLYLNDIDKANFYAQKLIANNNPIIKSIDFKFFKAYIYQAQNKEQEYRKEMQEILVMLKIKAKKKKKL